MPTVQLVDDPSVKASCRPVKVLQPEVTTAYFAKRKEKAEYDTEVIDHKTTKGQTLAKIAKQHGVSASDCKRTKTTKYLQIGEIVKVTKKKKKGVKVTFEKVDTASMNQELFVITETKNLQGEKVKVNILQGVEDVFVKKGEELTVQFGDKDTVLMEACVGDYSEEEEITNKDDFADWGIMKVKLAPKDDKKLKEWKDGLDCAGDNISRVFLLVDSHSDHSNPNFEPKYMLYKGYTGAGDDSKIRNHFLNQSGDYFEVTKVKWHDPVKNPQRLLHNSGGAYSPRSGTFGKVRRVYKDKKLVKKAHAGVDIFAPIGEQLYACLDGEVVSAKYRGSSSTKGYGNTVMIKVSKEDLDAARNDYKLEYKADGEQEKGPSFGDSDDRYLLYAHMKTMSVKEGDKVSAGDKIGTSGKSGNASTIKSASNRHLHFEVLDANDTSDYYQMKNRENAAFYINFVTADKEKQKNNKD